MASRRKALTIMGVGAASLKVVAGLHDHQALLSRLGAQRIAALLHHLDLLGQQAAQHHDAPVGGGQVLIGMKRDAAELEQMEAMLEKIDEQVEALRQLDWRAMV